MKLMKNEISKKTKVSALKGFESVINKALEYDPFSQNIIDMLAGKVLEVKCTSPAFSCYLFFGEKVVHLRHEYKGLADTVIRGSALSLGSLSVNGHQQVSFFDSGVTVSGDQELLNQLRQLIKNLDIEWEAALSDIIGDIPSYLIGETLKTSIRWKKNILKRGGKAIVEFSQEEARLTPSRNEIISFNETLCDTRNEVERLSARTRKLKDKLDKLFACKEDHLSHTRGT